MYKVMVVDDEEHIRTGICDLIPWNDLGFELIGAPENGKQALELFKSVPADLIITDICMPYMDGIELTKNVKCLNSSTHVIILSGYDQFEYAQNAIKYGVSDYILKPTTSKEMKSLLVQFKQKMDDEMAEMHYREGLRRQVQESLPILKERFLNELITFSMEETAIQRRSQILSIDLTKSPFAVMVMELDITEPNTEEEVQLLQFGLTNLCTESFADDQDIIVFSNSHGQTVMIWSGLVLDSFREQVLEKIKRMKGLVEDQLKYTMSVGIGNHVLLCKEIHSSYKEALTAIDYRFLLGNNQTIFINDVEKGKGSFSRPVDIEKRLMTNLKLGTIEKTFELLDDIFVILEKTGLEHCKLYMMELVVMINKTFYELGIDAGQLYGDSMKTMNELHHYKTLDQFKDWLKNMCKQANDYIQEQRNGTAREYVEQAKHVIDQQYHNNELSLTFICQHLHLSTSYFSMIFKRETSMTFGDYLSKTRIEKAKDLLKNTDFKTSQIAEMTGYNESNYFSTAFKKQVGVSPTEYRSVVRKK